MKNSIGIIRRIDDLGRIVIPKEMRNILNVKKHDKIEMIISEKISNLQKKRSVLQKKPLEDMRND